MTPQDDMLRVLLERSRRGAVPIRTEFIQRSRTYITDSPSRGAALGDLVSAGDSRGIHAYLLVHAIASHEPWDCIYPSHTWVMALGIDQTAEVASAKAALSRVWGRLEKHQLITRYRTGTRTAIRLLREDGSGKPYTRPRTSEDGVWFSLPYSFWTSGYFRRFNLAELAVLLVAISLPEGFNLPYERAQAWYGLSASTVKRGISGLISRKVLTCTTTRRIEPRSPTGYTDLRTYTLIGAFSKDSCRSAMRDYRRSRGSHPRKKIA